MVELRYTIAYTHPIHHYGIQMLTLIPSTTTIYELLHSSHPLQYTNAYTHSIHHYDIQMLTLIPSIITINKCLHSAHPPWPLHPYTLSSVTRYLCRVVSTPVSYSEGRVWISDRKFAIITVDFRGFPLSSKHVLYNFPRISHDRFLPDRFQFLVHIIILPFVAT